MCSSDLTLSTDLINHLRERRISIFPQITTSLSRSPLSPIWKREISLGLINGLAMEWEVYITNLYNTGVCIGDGCETLLWVGGMKYGIPSVKDIIPPFIYLLPISMLMNGSIELGHGRLPIKYYALAIKHRILKWKMLQKKVFHDPIICSFCFL